MIKKKNLLPLALLLGLALVGIKHALPAQAAQVLSLAAIPPRVEDLSADPGQTITKQIKVQNQGESELAINAEVIDFIVSNNEGTPLFLWNQEADNRWSLAEWLTVSPTRFVIKPGETKILDMLIVVPDDALPGGHYAAVIYKPAESTAPQESLAEVIPSVASLVYLSVNGEVNEEAYVRRLDIPRFSEYGPIKITAEIENLSDLHIKPQGVIKISNLFKKTLTTLKLDDKNIFPGRSRVFENTWGRKWLFGRFKTSLEASYGNQGQALIATNYFWVIPYKIIIVIVLIITLIILSLVYFKKKAQEVKEENAPEAKKK